MQCDFKVGDEVVCVYDGKVPGYPYSSANTNKIIVKDHVYTVSAIEGGPGIGELYCDVDCTGAGWLCVRFRPLVKKQTSISTFTKLLRPTKVKNGTRVPERV